MTRHQKPKSYRPSRGPLKGRRYSGQRAYREALARSRGFRSWADARRRGPAIRRTASLHKLSAEERLERDQSLDVLDLMRRRRRSLATASGEVGISPETALRWIGPALRQDARGRYRARARDSLPREMLFLTAEEPIWVTVPGSAEASEIGRYMNAVRAFARGRDRSALDPFRGKALRLGGRSYPFVTNPLTLRRLDASGGLRTEELYRTVQ